MALLSAASLATLLVQSGPSLIRTVGSLFGSGGEKAAGKVADIVESVSGLDNKSAEAVVNDRLKDLPPETVAQLEAMKVQLEKIAAEREKNKLDFDAALHESTQKTIRNGDKDGTEYVKETRPKIARQSAVAAFLYAFMMEGAKLFDRGTGAEPWILSALFSPAITYIGARSVDAFSRWKTGGQSRP